MSPTGGGVPQGGIAATIDRDLGGFDAFKEAFTKAALTRFGSGWAWLSVAAAGKLVVNWAEVARLTGTGHSAQPRR